jgi:S1-C subfamily serine protease
MLNRSHFFGASAILAVFALSAGIQAAEALNPKVAAAEAERVAAVEKVRPAVVAVFGPQMNGGGSGVLIDPEGYALTNFHVVAGQGPAGANAHLKCGLSDGVLYDAVLVGLDKIGDVSLIKLLPKKDGDKIISPKDGKFPVAKLGDSDKVKAGDWSMAMGNPFLLATDFTPTVTFGLVSGVRRYQYPEGKGLLEYTDCIQIDTSINPGNSGGPLFNMAGELIGINGRGSFEKRGRVNSGVGYAISINQIKNFMGHLRAGLDTDHASTGFLVDERAEEGAPRTVVTTILEDSDARRRGIDSGDQIILFAGRSLLEEGLNGYKNALGIYPRGWRVPIKYRAENQTKDTLVRLMGVIRREIPDEKGTKPPPGPQPPAMPVPPAVAKVYEAKPGYANYYFNKQERDRLLKEFRSYGDFTGLTGEWTIAGEGDFRGGGKSAVKVVMKDEKAAGADKAETVVKYSKGGIDLYTLNPIASGVTTADLRNPPGSGGMLVALYQYRQLLALAEKGFPGDGFAYGGYEPFYLPAADPQKPDFAKQRIDAEVIDTKLGAVPAKWYFAKEDGPHYKKGQLMGAEIYIVEREEDPCEMYITEYQTVDNRQVPKKIEFHFYGQKDGGRFVTLNVSEFKASK